MTITNEGYRSDYNFIKDTANVSEASELMVGQWKMVTAVTFFRCLTVELWGVICDYFGEQWLSDHEFWRKVGFYVIIFMFISCFFLFCFVFVFFACLFLCAYFMKCFSEKWRNKQVNVVLHFWIPHALHLFYSTVKQLWFWCLKYLWDKLATSVLLL